MIVVKVTQIINFRKASLVEKSSLFTSLHTVFKQQTNMGKCKENTECEWKGPIGKVWQMTYSPLLMSSCGWIFSPNSNEKGDIMTRVYVGKVINLKT